MPPILIGIVGASGSGKSSITNKLAALFPNTTVSIINADNYYKDMSHLSNKADYNFDEPKAIDYELLMGDIHKLCNNQAIVQPHYDFKKAKRTPGKSTEPANIVLVEGLFIFNHEPLFALFDLPIYVHTPQALALTRRLERDEVERHISMQENLEWYKRNVRNGYLTYIKPFKKDDRTFKIGNEKNPDTSLEVISSLITNFLDAQPKIKKRVHFFTFGLQQLSFFKKLKRESNDSPIIKPTWRHSL